jgi:hypothetical protein
VVLFFFIRFFGRHATYADGGATGPKVPFLVARHALRAFSRAVEAILSRERRCKIISEQEIEDLSERGVVSMNSSIGVAPKNLEEEKCVDKTAK